MKVRKVDLINALTNSNDLRLIEKLETVIASHQESDDWWNRLSEEERASIAEGEKQLDRGEGIPHEDVRAEIRAKLGL